MTIINHKYCYIFISIVVILYSYFFFYTPSDRFLVSFHGFQHGYYVMQILNGSFIPSDESFVNSYTKHYFFYHIIIAFFSKLTSINYLFLFPITNIFFLILTMLFLIKIGNLFSKNEYISLLFLTLPFSIYSFDADITFIFKYLFNNNFEIKKVISLVKFKFLDFYEPRALFPMGKFNAISGTPFGIMLFVISFFRYLNENTKTSGQIIINFLAILCHPISGFAILIINFISFIKINKNRIHIELFNKYFFTYILLFFTFYFYTSFLSSHLKSSFAISIPNGKEILSIISTYWIIFILIPILIFKNKNLINDELFLKTFLIFISFLLISIFLDLLGGNQYKFVIYNVFPYSILVVLFLHNLNLLNFFKNRYIKVIFIILISVLISAKFTMYSNSNWKNDKSFDITFDELNSNKPNIVKLAKIIKEKTNYSQSFFTDLNSINSSLFYANLFERRHYLNNHNFKILNESIKNNLDKEQTYLNQLLTKIKSCKKILSKDKEYISKNSIFFIFKSNKSCKNSKNYIKAGNHYLFLLSS